MSNMSYCRFQNTSADLADCAEILDLMFEGTGEPLSDSEFDHAQRLARQCLEVVITIVEDSHVDSAVTDVLRGLLARGDVAASLDMTQSALQEAEAEMQAEADAMDHDEQIGEDLDD